MWIYRLVCPESLCACTDPIHSWQGRQGWPSQHECLRLWAKEGIIAFDKFLKAGVQLCQYPIVQIDNDEVRIKVAAW